MCTSGLFQNGFSGRTHHFSTNNPEDTASRPLLQTCVCHPPMGKDIKSTPGSVFMLKIAWQKKMEQGLKSVSVSTKELGDFNKSFYVHFIIIRMCQHVFGCVWRSQACQLNERGRQVAHCHRLREASLHRPCREGEYRTKVRGKQSLRTLPSSLIVAKVASHFRPTDVLDGIPMSKMVV